MSQKTQIKEITSRDLARNAEEVFTEIVEQETVFKLTRYGVPVGFIISVALFKTIEQKLLIDKDKKEKPVKE